MEIKLNEEEILYILNHIENDIRYLEKEIKDLEKKTLYSQKIGREISNLRALKTHYIEEHIKAKLIRDKILNKINKK